MILHPVSPPPYPFYTTYIPHSSKASASELEFHIIGFLAAVLNNCVDCIQNVFSKKLLSLNFTFVELQFYTSLAAIIIQIPLWVLSSIYSGGHRTFQELHFDRQIIMWLAIDATSYHLQSVFAYALMSQISPVTHRHVPLSPSRKKTRRGG